MNHKPYPGYENQYKSFLQGSYYDQEELQKAKKAQGEAMCSYEVPEGMTIEDRVIPGPEDRPELKVRIFTPARKDGEKFPAVLDVHGGGWVAGNLDIDNARCIAIAKRVPAVVVSVDYRLSGKPGDGYPGPLMDCRAAYLWILDHAEDLGTNGKIGTHGSSAGANLCAGLSLYLRDHGEKQPELTVLNCPPTAPGFGGDMSYQQNFDLRMGPDVKAGGSEWSYLNGYDGTVPNYYAFPLFAHDLGMLNPHMVLTGEYDTLRDSGLAYAKRLLEYGVSTEIFSAARSCHCWTAAPGIYTDMTHDLIALAYQREFGMLDGLKKEGYQPW